MNPQDRPPPGIDPEIPSAARVYDYYLGGHHNFASDRAMAARALARWPALPRIMQANRAFLRRAVRFATEQGITQFLDLGSGIPTVGAVHDVARAVVDARVVYVDHDPVAAAHCRSILDPVPGTAIVEADAIDPDAVLDAPATRSLLDLDRPVALLLVALLHFVDDTRHPQQVLARYREALAPGSLLLISHASSDGDPDHADEHAELYRGAGTPMTMRSREQITALFDGFTLLDPGVVYLPLWRPDNPATVPVSPERFTGYAGAARRD